MLDATAVLFLSPVDRGSLPGPLRSSGKPLGDQIQSVAYGALIHIQATGTGPVVFEEPPYDLAVDAPARWARSYRARHDRLENCLASRSAARRSSESLLPANAKTNATWPGCILARPAGQKTCSIRTPESSAR